MNISDVFGNFPQRPDHKDFWRLSSIILKLDGRMKEATTEDEKQAVWDDNVDRWVDSDSLNYMAMQRAMRPLGITTAGDLQKNAELVILMNVLYQEGFQIGAEFATDREFDNEIDQLDETGLRLLLSAYERHVKESHERGEEPLDVKSFYEEH